MPIRRSKAYIAKNPRFVLTSASRPDLSTRKYCQIEMVYNALEPHAGERSLEDLAQSCRDQDYTKSYKRTIAANAQSVFLRMSILHHLRIMEKKGLIKEV